MSRLASLRGPSSPSPSPVRPRQPSTPPSPSRTLESTYHRKIRTSLQNLKAAAKTWDELVLIDGLKAAKGLVDARTELDNALDLIPDGQPRTRIVGPKLALMEQRISELDAVVTKLRKIFHKMNALIESMEGILIEAYRAKGWKWVSEEPLWLTWPLEKFVSSIPEILPPYHRSLNTHEELANKLRKHTISFEDSREAVSRWAEQAWLEEDGWNARWEDLCAVEVERWNT